MRNADAIAALEEKMRREAQEQAEEEAERARMMQPHQNKVQRAVPPPLPPEEISLSAVIMAHPSRANQVASIQAVLDRSVSVVWDQVNNRWDTGRRAMLAYDPACSYHVVIQDDLLIPRDLLAGLERALAYVPRNVPVAGYIGRVRPARDLILDTVTLARRCNASWVTTRCLYWGPLICVPTNCIEEMVTFCDPIVGIANYDLRISRYFEELGIRTWSTWPSIVDHDDGPSLVPGRSGADRTRPGGTNRIAHDFCGTQTSVLDLDWSGLIVDSNI